MKAKIYAKLVGKKVRMKGATDDRIGVIADSAGVNTWWIVEWSDGKKTKVPQRMLEIVVEEELR